MRRKQRGERQTEGKIVRERGRDRQVRKHLTLINDNATNNTWASSPNRAVWKKCPGELAMSCAETPKRTEPVRGRQLQYKCSFITNLLIKVTAEHMVASFSHVF